MSESFALITGAVAATAEAPQIAVPTPIKVVVFPLIFNALPTKKATKKAADSVKIITKRDWLPTWKTRYKFSPNPRRIMDICRSVLEVNLTPELNRFRTLG